MGTRAKNTWECCGTTWACSCKVCHSCGKEKPKIGRPTKYDGPSVKVSVRLNADDVEKLIKKFGKAGLGIEEVIKAWSKRN